MPIDHVVSGPLRGTRRLLREPAGASLVDPDPSENEGGPNRQAMRPLVRARALNETQRRCLSSSTDDSSSDGGSELSGALLATLVRCTPDDPENPDEKHHGGSNHGPPTHKRQFQSYYANPWPRG